MKRGMEYLEKNLCDSIFEMMLKLDEIHNSSICIYYTYDLAAYLINTDIDNLFNELAKFKEFAGNSLGRINIETGSDSRIGIRVFSDGIDKIMQSNPRRFFLRKLIEAIRYRDCGIDKIKEIFAEETDDFTCKEINDSEFQYVVYFNDENIDEYKYCFTFDAMGSYYHRLIDYDFDHLVHDSCN